MTTIKAIYDKCTVTLYLLLKKKKTLKTIPLRSRKKTMNLTFAISIQHSNISPMNLGKKNEIKIIKLEVKK